jgi:hypothetical protein
MKFYTDGGYRGTEFQAVVKQVSANVSVEIVNRSDQA